MLERLGKRQSATVRYVYHRENSFFTGLPVPVSILFSTGRTLLLPTSPPFKLHSSIVYQHKKWDQIGAELLFYGSATLLFVALSCKGFF